jgi:hypothetical protein
MARRHDVHVSKVPGGSRWKVSQSGPVLSTHNRQDNAIANGRSEAKHDSVDLVIHGRDGRIRSKDSYGNDPLPPRDREH